MKTTLLYWTFTRAPYHFIGTLFFAGWAYASGGPWGIGTGVFLTLVHGLIWYKEHQHREKVRGLIWDRVLVAEAQWEADGLPWHGIQAESRIGVVMDDGLVVWYGKQRKTTLKAALSRPDLWGEWTLNVYNGETDRPFATGNNDLWPRWVFEPVKG